MESSPPDAAQRDAWERQADVTRAKLVVTLGELDRRRQELFDVRRILARHRKGIAILLGAAAFVTFAAAIVVSRRRAPRPGRLTRQRVDALARAWEHPQLVAPKSHSFLYELGRRVALTGIESIGVRALERLLENRAPLARPSIPQMAAPSP